MKRIFAPWRMKFITNKKEPGCLFCKKFKSKNDKKNLVLCRSRLGFVILNLYPYTNGHLMVVPKRHIGDITKLTDDELLEIMHLTNLSIKVLKNVLKPDGFNVGINLGKVAGAGISAHLHIHIVPRWLADTNFMPVVFDTKIVSEALNETYKKLSRELEKIKQLK
ncbi:MAG: HIT domain-containing protein [Elusimicrobiota bacterium]|nr:HIT domain-containing protein [Elusimicrobiota bacterium]